RCCSVTGVQTCALPISPAPSSPNSVADTAKQRNHSSADITSPFSTPSANGRHRGTAIRSTRRRARAQSRQGPLGGTSIEPGFQTGVLATILEPRPVLGTGSDNGGGERISEGCTP